MQRKQMQENQTFIKEKKKKISVSPLLFTTANKPNRMLTQGCAAGGQSGQSGIIMNANNITDRRGKSTEVDKRKEGPLRRGTKEMKANPHSFKMY